MKSLPHGPGRTATVSYILCDYFKFSVLNLILVVLSCLELDLSLLFKELLKIVIMSFQHRVSVVG